MVTKGKRKDRQMMERDITGTHLSDTYWSLEEFARQANADATDTRERIRQIAAGELFDAKTKKVLTSEWYGGVESFDDALRLARDGWNEQLPDALALADDVIQLAEKEHMVDTFQTVWDVSGAEVDMGKYVTGEPECMLESPVTKTSNIGRTVTLVASIGASSIVSADAIIQRGQLAVALALALSRLGHAVEIWADHSGRSRQYRSKDKVWRIKYPQTAYMRTLVKGVDDELDPARVMFALAHPAMLRALAIGVMDGYPAPWEKVYSAKERRGVPIERRPSDIARFPEGTIFMPEMTQKYSNAQVIAFMRGHLDNLGLLAE